MIIGVRIQWKIYERSIQVRNPPQFHRDYQYLYSMPVLSNQFLPRDIDTELIPSRFKLHGSIARNRNQVDKLIMN